jgi:hypothetical protein
MHQYGGHSSSESVLLLMKYHDYKKKVFTIYVNDLFVDDEEYWSEVSNKHQTFSLSTLERKQTV